MEKIVNVCSFKELPRIVQDKLVKKFKDNYPGDNWSDDTVSEIESELEEMGYSNIDVSFSGFWSQGDGASFTADLDVLEYIKYLYNKAIEKGEIPPIYTRLINVLENNHVWIDTCTIIRDRWVHYVHWNTTSLYMEYDKDEHITGENWLSTESLLEDLRKHIFAHHQQLNKEIYSRLEEEYYSITSDDYVREILLDDNDSQYLNDGTIFHESWSVK